MKSTVKITKEKKECNKKFLAQKSDSCVEVEKSKVKVFLNRVELHLKGAKNLFKTTKVCDNSSKKKENASFIPLKGGNLRALRSATWWQIPKKEESENLITPRRSRPTSESLLGKSFSSPPFWITPVFQPTGIDGVQHPDQGGPLHESR